MDTWGPPRHRATPGPSRVLQAVTPKTTSSCILRMLTDFRTKTYLRAVTIKATLSCILCIRNDFGATQETSQGPRGPPEDPKSS